MRKSGARFCGCRIFVLAHPLSWTGYDGAWGDQFDDTDNENRRQENGYPPVKLAVGEHKTSYLLS